MVRLLQSLVVFLIFSIFILLSCKRNDTIDAKNVFTKAVKSDSLAYYFPSTLNDKIEKRNTQYKNFEQKWYSTSLYALREPILYTKSDSVTIYRLLWLRSFHKPVCFSIKEYRGHYYLNAKTLDRQPKFIPEIETKGIDENTGKEIYDTIQKADRFALIDFDTIKVISNTHWNDIENLIIEFDFWNSPVSDPNIDISMDGSTWILEGRKNGKYHFIKRRNARGKLRDLAKRLNEWSGLSINDDSFY